MKISATVITFNEEENIKDCLVSLDFVDEIIVLDSGSTDRTEDICRSYPKVRFYQQNWLGYGGQKNRAAELASHDWILNLDADERISPLLMKEIVTADFKGFCAFRMARENYFGKKWVRHCGWYPDYTTRLYDRRSASFSLRKVHETLECSGPVATLRGNLLHFTYRNISDYLKRLDRYSSLAADEHYKKGHKTSLLRMLFSPPVTFVKMYLLRMGFLDGWVGFILSTLYSVYTFCKYAKLYELTTGSATVTFGDNRVNDKHAEQR